MERFNRAFFRDTWRILSPYWKGKERWSAYGLIAIVVGLTFAMVYLSVRITIWYRGFYDALQHYDEPGFWSDMLTFGWLAALYIFSSVYRTYLREMLEIRWRRWMTRGYLTHWLSLRTYYHMQILSDTTDNPDQRIADDISAFIRGTLQLSLGLLSALVTIGSYIGLLWVLSSRLILPFEGANWTISGYLVWAALIYSVIGTLLITHIGRPLIGLNFNQQRYDADFRFGLVRVRENPESIALYGGEEHEHRNLMERFTQIFGNYWRIMVRTKLLNWFSSGYAQIAIVFPFLVVAPSYFLAHLGMGVIIEVSSAFAGVQGGLSYIVTSYAELAAWHAVVDRLAGFTQHIEETRKRAPGAGHIRHTDDGPLLHVEHLTLQAPDGRPLLTNLSLRVPPGDSLLLTGPSGSGKSTFLRAVAGIWPFGDGKIERPPRQESLFLPQKPYLPLGSLREILLYPHGAKDTSTETLANALRAVKLDRLIPSLDDERQWSLILSLGEQQRLAFARILLQRPRWIYMDEATSALDEGAEEELYVLLRRELPDSTVISVGHRSTLLQYHRTRLDLNGLGGWTFAPPQVRAAP